MTKITHLRLDGRLCIYDKPPSGDRLAPEDDPIAFFSSFKFDSNFNVLSATDIRDVPVNHAQVNGVTGTGWTGAPAVGSTPQTSSQAIADGQIVQTDHLLYTHGLGYVPFHMIIYDGQCVAGTVVQDDSNDGRVRRVSSFATTTGIYLRETGVSSASNLAAVSRTYRVITIRDVEPDPAKPKFWVKTAGGKIVLGQGKITDDLIVMRRTIDDEEAAFFFPVTTWLDVKNGCVRSVSPISGVKDDGPFPYVGSLFEVDAIKLTYDGYEP